MDIVYGSLHMWICICIHRQVQYQNTDANMDTEYGYENCYRIQNIYISNKLKIYPIWIGVTHVVQEYKYQRLEWITIHSLWM